MNADQAKQLLVHYFRVTMEAAGIPFSWDNQSEIESIIDCILQAAKQ